MSVQEGSATRKDSLPKSRPRSIGFRNYSTPVRAEKRVLERLELARIP